MTETASPSESAALEPIESARGLPNAHYVDPAMYDREKHRVLFANWAGIGFAQDIPEPGDAIPLDFLGVPLLMLRDREGTVKVFENTCRHRGMILVDGPRRIEGAIRCPYHSWCYDLSGALRATPHVGGPGQNSHAAINRDALNLMEFRCHIWRDVIFVNIDGRAPDFEVANADLVQRWAEFDQPLFSGGPDSSFELTLQTNWKLAIENYCESYHLPWIHPGLNSYSRLEDHYNIIGACFSGQGSYVYRQLEADGDRFSDFAGLSEKWETGAEYASLYPNVLWGVHRDYAFAVILRPDGPERTVERIQLYYASEADQSEARRALRTENTRLWKVILEEDVGVVEGMQRGRHGVLFDGGRFSPAMDGPTHRFHQWIAAQMA